MVPEKLYTLEKMMKQWIYSKKAKQVIIIFFRWKLHKISRRRRIFWKVTYGLNLKDLK